MSYWSSYPRRCPSLWHRFWEFNGTINRRIRTTGNIHSLLSIAMRICREWHREAVSFEAIRTSRRPTCPAAAAAVPEAESRRDSRTTLDGYRNLHGNGVCCKIGTRRTREKILCEKECDAKKGNSDRVGDIGNFSFFSLIGRNAMWNTWATNCRRISTTIGCGKRRNPMKKLRNTWRNWPILRQKSLTTIDFTLHFAEQIKILKKSMNVFYFPTKALTWIGLRRTRSFNCATVITIPWRDPVITSKYSK
jgi:hypothetical protein